MADIDITTPGANEAALRSALFNLRTFNGALVERTTDLTAQNITTAAAVAFQSAISDPLGIWSAGAPTRLTIPSSLNGAIVMAFGQVRISSDTADTWSQVYLTWFNSGSTQLSVSGIGQFEKGGTNASGNPTLVQVVSTGDYLEMSVRTESDTSVTIHGAGGTTRMGIFVLGMPDLA